VILFYSVCVWYVGSGGFGLVGWWGGGWGVGGGGVVVGNVEGWRACTDLLPFACESILVQEPEQQVSLSEGSDTAQVIVNMNPS